MARPRWDRRGGSFFGWNGARDWTVRWVLPKPLSGFKNSAFGRKRLTRLFIKGIAGLQRNLFGLGLEMLFENVAIIDLAHVEPAQRVHSSEFETQIAGTLERLGLPPNMLQALAGIEERRWGRRSTE